MAGLLPPFFMAHPKILRTEVEVVAACGMNVKEIIEHFGVPRSTIHYWLNPVQAQRQRSRSRDYYRANADHVNARKRRYYEKNPGLRGDECRKYREANLEKVKAAIRRHYQENPEPYISRARIRNCKLKEIPLTEIERLMCSYYYEDAKRLTEETGVVHEVDHIWPVSRGGPHLPWNLRVITMAENRKKGDKL